MFCTNVSDIKTTEKKNKGSLNVSPAPTTFGLSTTEIHHGKLSKTTTSDRNRETDRCRMTHRKTRLLIKQIHVWQSLSHYSTCPHLSPFQTPSRWLWTAPFLSLILDYQHKQLWGVIKASKIWDQVNLRNSNNRRLCRSATELALQWTPTTYFWSLNFKCFHCKVNYSDLLLNWLANCLGVAVNFIW